MTIIKIFKQKGKIKGIIASGHTDFADSGSDILCASISTLIQTAGHGLKDMVSQETIFTIDEDIPELKLFLPDNLPDERYHDAQIILKTCILGLRDLVDSRYHKFIKMEVKNDVY